MTDPPYSLKQSYESCRYLVRNHYENFPVASLLLPRRLRHPLTVIYAFARQADDIVDEGTATKTQRLTQLDDYRAQLDRIRDRQGVRDPVFLALQDVILQHHLGLEPFYNLLTAFRMDVTQNRYPSLEALLKYCRYSANPVGRLVLALSGQSNATTVAYSDAICSALQLINFMQDLDEDYQKRNRIYVPLDDMMRFGIDENDFARRKDNPTMREMVDLQCHRAKTMLLEGAQLGHLLEGRLGFEIRATIQGGLSVLDKLARRESVFTRPLLTRTDWLKLLVRVFSKPAG